MLGVAVLAGSVLCGSLLLVDSTGRAGVRDALSSLPADRVEVTVRVVNPPSPVAATRSTVDRATADAYGSSARWTSSAWAVTEWTTTAEGLYTTLVEFDDPSAEAELLDGAWPSTPPGIALPQSAARSLGLAVGDELVLGDASALADGRSPVRLRIDGLYRADTRSGAFWAGDPLGGAGDAQEFPRPRTNYFEPVHAVGPLITAPGGIDAAQRRAAQLVVSGRPSFAGTDVAGLAALRDAAADAETAIAAAVPHPDGSLFVDTGIPDALGEIDAGLAAARTAALAVALTLLAVIAASIAAVAQLVRDARDAERDALRRRGASRPQRAAPVLLDVLVLAAPVALLAPWGGALLYAAVVATPPLNAAGLPQRMLPGGPEHLVALALATGLAVLICLPVGARGAGATAASAVPAVVGGTAVIALAALLLWRSQSGSAPDGDVLSALTPAAVLAAVTLLGVIAVRAGAPLLARLGARARGPVAPLVGWSAARGAGRLGGIALVALTVGASFIALGTSATELRSARDQAVLAVGAPARVLAPEGAGAPVLRRQMIVSRADQTGGQSEDAAAGTAVQILGLDAAARELLSGGTEAVRAVGGAVIREALPASDPVDAGPSLPEGSVALRLRAELDAPAGTGAEIAVALQDGSGAVTTLPLGDLVAGAGPVELDSAPGAMPVGGGPLRLVAMTARLRGQESDRIAPLAVSVDGVMAVVGDADDAAVPMAMTGSWSGFGPDPADPPSVAGSQDGVRIEASVRLGAAPVVVGAAGWSPGAPIRAVVPVSLADELDASPGSALTGYLAGADVSLRVVVGDLDRVPGAASATDLEALAIGLPSTARDRSSIVVDGRALVHGLVEAAAYGALVDESWQARATAGSIDAATLSRRMEEAPLRAVVPAGSALVVCAGLLLAVAGLAASTSAATRSRRLQSAQLRAIGLSRRAALGIQAAEAGLVAIAGTAIGLLAGRAALEPLAANASAAERASPTALVVPWQALVLVPAALLAALALVSLALAAAQRSLVLADLLRAGAD